MKTLKVMNSLVRGIDRFINFITTIFFILIIIFGAYAIYDAYYVYDNAKLNDELLSLRPVEEGDFSLSTLQEINKDICGWIRIDNTNMDYPIVIGVDNNEYLNLDYKKEFSATGCIFLDYKNNRDFKDGYSIVYGHNMEADLMFADIKKYQDVGYFEEHTTGMLYTNDGQYSLEIILLSNVDAYSGEVYGLHRYANGYSGAIYRNLQNHVMVQRDVKVSQGDKLLLLSTCDSAESNDRLVLLAKMTKVEGNKDTVINEGTDSSLIKLEKEKEKEVAPTIDEPVIEQPMENKVVKHLSVRTIALIILFIIVLIIFIILIINIAKSNKKGKHSLHRKL